MRFFYVFASCLSMFTPQNNLLNLDDHNHNTAVQILWKLLALKKCISWQICKLNSFLNFICIGSAAASLHCNNLTHQNHELPNWNSACAFGQWFIVMRVSQIDPFFMPSNFRLFRRAAAFGRRFVRRMRVPRKGEHGSVLDISLNSS